MEERSEVWSRGVEQGASTGACVLCAGRGRARQPREQVGEQELGEQVRKG